MPQIGEQRTSGNETRVWNGAGWERIASQAKPAAAPAEESALSRFFGGAMSTSPLNPMNLIHAAAHPIDTVGHMLSDPILSLLQAGEHAYNAVANPGNEDALGRGTEVFQAAKSLGGAVPFVGSSAVHAGDKLGHGDLAGGAGELAGLASSALIPEVAGKTKQGAATAGRVAREVGSVSGPAMLNIAEKLPLIGDTVKATRGELPKIADAAIRGLKGEEPVAVDPYMPNRSGAQSRGSAPSTTFDNPPDVPDMTPFHEKPLYEQMAGLEGVDPRMANEFSSYSGELRRPEPTLGSAAYSTPSSNVPRLVKGAPSLTDTLNTALQGVKNVPSAPQPMSLGSSPVPKYSDPRAGGFDVSPRDVPELSDDAYNQMRNAPYGEGHVMPSNVMPTERVNSALDGLNQPQNGSYNLEHQTFVPDFTFEGEAIDPGQPPAVGGAAPGFEITKNRLPDAPGAVTPETPETPDLPASWTPFVKAADRGKYPNTPSVDANGVATMPKSRLHSILQAFTDPATETPFDLELLNQILKDPNGAEFAKPYGPSGNR